jgi:hypothetical protein
LPETGGDKPQRARFKRYPIGYFHIDSAEVQSEEGRLYLFVAIDRTSKFAFAQLHEKATRRVAGDFLRALVGAVPYQIHTVLTDNGTHFTDPAGNCWPPDEIRQMMERKELFRAHSFELACWPTRPMTPTISGSAWKPRAPRWSSPPPARRHPYPLNRRAYRGRNVIERMFCGMKD